MPSSVSCCGRLCSDCPAFGSECQGCHASQGKPPWLAESGHDICPLYQCAVNDREMKSCGECYELPCAKFKELKDPVLSAAEFQRQLEERVSLMRTLYFS